MKEITKEQFQKLVETNKIELSGHAKVLWDKVLAANNEMQERIRRKERIVETRKQLDAEERSLEAQFQNLGGQAYAHFDHLYDKVLPSLEKNEDGEVVYKNAVTPVPDILVSADEKEVA